MMYIAIYQIDMDRDPKDLAFMDLERTKRIQNSADIDSSIYNKVFEGAVKAENLEDIYYIFNQAHPEGYIGHSLSVSDVVQVVEDNPFGSHFYFCDSIGFQRIDFDSSKAQDLLHPAPSMDGPIQLWARLGISLEVNYEELQQLKQGGLDAQKLLVSLIQSDRCQMNGDTYFPDCANEGYLDEELNFDLPVAPLSAPSEKKPSLDDKIKNSQAKTGNIDTNEKGREEAPER